MKGFLVIAVVLGAVGYGGWYYLNSQKPTLPPGVAQPVTFTECEKYFPVDESYPRHCTNGAGVVVTEDIGNAPEVRDTIQVSVPAPSDIISSPVYIKGQAMADWFDNDNSISVSILDTNGTSVGGGKIDSKNLVSYGRSYPFDGTILFNRPSYSAIGVVVIKKNASDTVLRIPVTFK